MIHSSSEVSGVTAQDRGKHVLSFPLPLSLRSFPRSPHPLLSLFSPSLSRIECGIRTGASRLGSNQTSHMSLQVAVFWVPSPPFSFFLGKGGEALTELVSTGRAHGYRQVNNALSKRVGVALQRSCLNLQEAPLV